MNMRRGLSVLLVLASMAVLLAGCTRDPNVRKKRYFESAQAHFEKGKYREAAIEYLNAIQIDPRYADAHYGLAQCYLRLEIWGGAYQELLRTVDLHADNLRAQIDLGNLLLAGRQFEQAQERAELVLRQDPKNVDARILLANSYAALQDLSASLQEMQTAIQLDPQRSSSYLNLAVFQTGARQIKEAEESFKKAIEIDPKSVQAHLAIGNFYQALRRWAEAEQAFRQAIALEPKTTAGYAALGLLYLAQEQPERAEQVLREAKQILKDVSEGVRLLGDFYFNLNQLDKALAEYASLYREYPGDLRIKKNYVQLLILQGKLEQAIKLNDEILKKNARDVDGLIARGQILSGQGRHNQAIPEFEAALKAEPDHALAHYHLGLAMNFVGNTARAEIEWREALRLRPNLLAAQEALATLMAGKGDFDGLNSIADQIISADPRSINGYLLRATAQSAKGNLRGAEVDLSTAMKLAPGDPRPYVQLGGVRAVEKRYSDAEKLFLQALERSPDFANALRALLSIYVVQQKPAKALQRAEAQVAKAPTSSAMHFLLGQASLLNKNEEKAEAAFVKAIELDKANADAYIALAQLQFARGTVGKAIATSNQAIQNNPRDVRNYILLGTLEESRGSWQRAQELYEKALQVHPDNPVAANNLAYLLLEHGGNVDVALSYAQIGRRGLPEAPASADTLAWAYYHKGAYALAQGLLEDTVKKMPQNPSYHYHLGLVYAKLGDKARARLHLSRALEINPQYPKAVEIRKSLSELASDNQSENK